MAVNERFDFSGRSVLITGGGKGIGKVYVEEFAKAGARVAAADIDVQAANSVAASLSRAGHDAIAIGVDIADESSTKAMAAAKLVGNLMTKSSNHIIRLFAFSIS